MNKIANKQVICEVLMEKAKDDKDDRGRYSREKYFFTNGFILFNFIIVIVKVFHHNLLLSEDF